MSGVRACYYTTQVMFPIYLYEKIILKRYYVLQRVQIQTNKYVIQHTTKREIAKEIKRKKDKVKSFLDYTCKTTYIAIKPSTYKHPIMMRMVMNDSITSFGNVDVQWMAQSRKQIKKRDTDKEKRYR